MFHCYQRENNYLFYPNDFILFKYSLEKDNFNSKYNENLLLVNSYVNNIYEDFIKFLNIRRSRYDLYVIQEILTEQLEGLAEFIGLKALKIINLDKYNNRINDYINLLKDDVNLLFNVRRISYYSGVLFFLCLDKYNYDYSMLFNMEEPYFNSIEIKASNYEIINYDNISNKLSEFINERKNIIYNILIYNNYIESNSKITAYDPMNTFRIGDYLYSKYFIMLNNEIIKEEVVIIMKPNSLDEVIGYYKKN